MTTIERPRATPQVGDRAPFSYGMTADKAFYSFESQAGRTAVLILAGRLAPSTLAPLLAEFGQRAADFARCEADVVLLVDSQSPHVQATIAAPPRGAQAIYCLPEIFYAWGFDNSEPSVVVIDRNARVIAPVERGDEAAMAEAALACAAATPSEPPRDVLLPAPVLLIPNIFTAAFCRTLIDHFENGPKTVGGMASIDARGNAIHKIDESKKKRADCVIAPDDPLCGGVIDALSRACVPEMKKAFQFDACHTDRVLIARYDDAGGYFRRHRDNSSPAVAFRQFALSVNLNSEDYEGGYLLFPEYNSHRYKPGRGAGVIFSSSLLHEATPVTKGSRYVLLTFLHNAEGEARRLAVASAARAA
jgi:predicted 2-oxoglutarate/Fe(II)-dependent dioxygenase YbiX